MPIYPSLSTASLYTPSMVKWTEEEEGERGGGGGRE